LGSLCNKHAFYRWGRFISGGKSDRLLERIYIGRRFKNDTERLEKLFDLYTKMTAAAKAKPSAKAKRGNKIS